ncbi:MAG: hypothetical protein JNL67_20115 [Planctomycetaceae bacterium]|nr:hypothetical protein [Planctomycetaceae bacterium]
MPWSWIGVDEAGYGARLGPLVVSASWWQVDSPDLPTEDFAAEPFLHEIDRWSWQAQFESNPTEGRDKSPPFLVADSKKVYQAGAGLEKLETIVTSLLRAIETRPRSTKALGVCDVVEATNNPSLPLSVDSKQVVTAEMVWRLASNRYESHAQRVRLSGQQDVPYWLTVEGNRSSFAPALSTSKPPRDPAQDWASNTVVPCGLFSALVSEEEFNRGLVQYRNKANLLSATSVCLANQVLQRCPAGQTVVIDFDRHGGRKRYLPLLIEYFAADWPQVLSETESESSYQWEHAGRRVLARFTVDGERRYPVAAASLASKYARELGMHCVNTYWQCQIPDLKPSAGYPVDAARMMAELAARLNSLPVSHNQVWRDA